VRWALSLKKRLFRRGICFRKALRGEAGLVVNRMVTRSEENLPKEWGRNGGNCGTCKLSGKINWEE